MNKPIVLCDVDGVILDWFKSFVAYFNKRFGTQMREEDISSHDLAESFGVTQDEMSVILQNYEQLNYLEVLPVIPGAIEGIKTLIEDYSVVLISACGVIREVPRKAFFKKLLPGIPIVFTASTSSCYVGGQGRLSRLETALALGADFIIEDNEKELENWDPSVAMPICYAQPWNFSLETTHPEIPRLTWPEIVDLLMNKRPMIVPSVWIA